MSLDSQADHPYPTAHKMDIRTATQIAILILADGVCKQSGGPMQLLWQWVSAGQARPPKAAAHPTCQSRRAGLGWMILREQVLLGPFEQGDGVVSFADCRRAEAELRRPALARRYVGQLLLDPLGDFGRGKRIGSV